VSEKQALDHAIAIIESYQNEIKRAKHMFKIDLVALGFCQGEIFKHALEDIEARRILKEKKE